MNQPSFDRNVAQRWFAVEFNNTAWDLVEAPARSPEEVERMLHLAHAAWVHWQAVGNALNEQRALHLLALAYATANRPVEALAYAEQCRELSDRNGDEQTGFDRATALAGMTHVLERAGRAEEARTWREQARRLLERLDGDEQAAIGRLLQ